ncbi:MAG: LamG domain-containing protein, partial [Planctomycetota bacterium]|jgi:hypothetical protein
VEAETGAEPNIVSTILWDNDYDLWNCTAQYSFVEENFDANLVSYWKLDGDAVDSAGTNNGTIYGATPTTGQIGDALDFDNVNDDILIGDKDNLDFGANDSFSIVAWIQVRSSDSAIVWKKRPSAGGWLEGYSFIVHPTTGTQNFGIEGNSNDSAGILGDTVLTDGKWHHVAGVRDVTEDKLYLYVDGVSDATPVTDTTTTSLVNSANFMIGADSDRYHTAFFDGIIDDVRIYDKALSAEEIEVMYEAGLAGGEYGSPMFADANSGDYHLLSERGRYRASTDEWILDDMSSPCIDGGDPYASLGGELWPNGGRVNMGAYGGTTEGSRSEWPFAGDLNLDGIVNLADFALLAEDWLEALPWAE